MDVKKHLLIAIIGILLIIPGLTTAQANAQTSFGIRAGTYDETGDLFLGAGVNTYIGNRFYFNPNFEYVTVDPGTYMTFNMDFHYDFGNGDPIYAWAGAGPALHYFSNPKADASNSDLGMNFLFGLGFDTNSNVLPFVQAKAILADHDDFSIGFGLRF